MLTLNLNLLYTVVNVLVLFLLLRKFLYKPVMNIIAQRQKQVDDALAAAETSKKEAAAALNTAQDKLRNVDAEAAARRTAYEEQAEKEKQQLLADAQKQADAIVAEGKRNAEAERQHKLREADAQTTALARAMCEKLLERNLTAQDDARLLDDLLEKAGAGNGN
jgi:F-type H+-transporting ATPase subunit b